MKEDQSCDMSLQAHSIVREWTLGKELLRNDLQEEDREQKLNEFLKMRGSDCPFDSCLSASVAQRVLLTHDHESEVLLEVVDKNTNLLNLELFTFERMTGYRDGSVLLSDKDFEMDVFGRSAEYLKRCALIVHHHVAQMSSSEFSSLNVSYIFEEPRVFEWAYEAHISPQQKSLFSFTLLVPFLERVIQDAMFNHLIIGANSVDEQVVSSKIPNKLNDLLVTAEVESVFGTDVVFLIRSFIGPLSGLNLRNVAIHGFMKPSEFHPAYTSLLLLLVPTISNILQQKFNDRYCRRVLKTLSNSYGFEGSLVVDNNSNLDEESKWKELLDHSLFVMAPWKESWMDAIRLYHEGLVYHSLVALFPLIEHSIRRIFVCTNQRGNLLDKLWISRLLTADTTVLYTTLDILLANTMNGTSSTSVECNAIFEELDVSIENLIFDILVWTKTEDIELKLTYDCPRIRDHVCHGNIDPMSVSPIIADRVMVMCLALMARFDIRNRTDVWPEAVKQSMSYVNCLYTPLFHPKSLLSKEIGQCMISIERFYHLIYSTTELEKSNSDDPAIHTVETHLINVIESVIHDSMRDRLVLPQCIQKDINISGLGEKWNHILFSVNCHDKELSIILTCRKIVNHVLHLEQALTSSILHLQQKVQERTAWKRDRKYFAALGRYSRCMLLLLSLLSIISQVELLELCSKQAHFVSNNDLLQRIWKFSGSLHGAIKGNKLDKAFELVHAFFIGKNESYPHYKSLSTKESDRLLTHIHHRFHQLSHQC